MKHRIAAGVIVENEDEVLLVRHPNPGVYDSRRSVRIKRQRATKRPNAKRSCFSSRSSLHPVSTGRSDSLVTLSAAVAWLGPRRVARQSRSSRPCSFEDYLSEKATAEALVKWHAGHLPTSKPTARAASNYASCRPGTFQSEADHG